jgi:hypothetical protein
MTTPFGLGTVLTSMVKIPEAEAVNAAGRILQPCLSLVREVQISVRGENEVVQTFEAF